MVSAKLERKSWPSLCSVFILVNDIFKKNGMSAGRVKNGLSFSLVISLFNGILNSGGYLMPKQSLWKNISGTI